MASISNAADLNENALRDNIERKGKNSYYFAHAHRANGPKWDGKPQPRLLSKHSISSNDHNSTLEEGAEDNTANEGNIALLKDLQLSQSNCAYKSNITKYAFSDEGGKVKLYVEMNGVGEACTNEDVCLEWNENSFKLVIKNYPGRLKCQETQTSSSSSDCPVQCLSLGELYGSISSASFKKKKDRVIVTLVKKIDGDDDPETWSSIRANSGDENEV